MGLFGFGKKKEETTSCGCAGGCGPTEAEIENAKYIILGGGCCQKSTDTMENVQKALDELGIDEKVVSVGDMAKIATYGVMSTPALVIDKKVVAYGKLIKVEDAKALIQNAQ